MTTIHQRVNQDNVHERVSTVERLQSRWNSGSRVIVDKPPSQPLNLRQMSRKPSHGSVKKSYRCHKDLVMCHSRRENTVGRLQQINSMWTSSSGVITDSPPLQPLSRRESAVGKLQTNGSQASFDTASCQVLIPHRTIERPSRVSALEHPGAMKNYDIFEDAIRTRCILNHCILNMSRMHLSHTASRTGIRLNCTASPGA
jgi:hypothetical protein